MKSARERMAFGVRFRPDGRNSTKGTDPEGRRRLPALSVALPRASGLRAFWPYDVVEQYAVFVDSS